MTRFLGRSTLVAILLATAATASGADMTYSSRPRANSPAGRARLEEVLVTANGRPLFKRWEMLNGMSITYYLAALELHRQEMAWLRAQVEGVLLEAEAIRRSMTVAELLRSEVRPEPVPPARIAQFLQERGRAGSQLTPEERAQLDKEREMVARRAFLDRLWQDAKPTISLEEPEIPFVAVGEGNTSPVLGENTAAQTLMVFCASTSPDCRTLWGTLQELSRRHGPKLRVVHRDFPLAGAPAGLPAAMAARCAQRQGKFWEYQGLLYANQDKLGAASLKAYARALGLVGSAFDHCLERGETASEVEMDLAEGQRIRVPGVPTVILDGVYLPGPVTGEEITRRLEGRIAR